MEKAMKTKYIGIVLGFILSNFLYALLQSEPDFGSAIKISYFQLFMAVFIWFLCRKQIVNNGEDNNETTGKNQ